MYTRSEFTPRKSQKHEAISKITGKCEAVFRKIAKLVFRMIVKLREFRWMHEPLTDAFLDMPKNNTWMTLGNRTNAPVLFSVFFN